MADFLDFDSLEMNVDEQVNGAKEHPLKGMKTGAKMAYVGGLLFACHADDNTLQKEERSLVMGVAHSLGLGKEEVDDLVEMVVGLTDKIAYLKEIVATLKDRKTILFFLCDMIKAMGADGELNENAQKLIGAIEKLVQLDDNDKQIVEEYRCALQGKTVNIGGLNKTSDNIVKQLLDWFGLKDDYSLNDGVSRKKKDNVKPKNSTKNKKICSKKTSVKTVKKESVVANETNATSQDNQKPSEPIAEPKPKFNSTELIDATMKRFVEDFQQKSSGFSPVIFYADSAPFKKQMNVMSSMNIRETHFLFQFDNTSFGGAKEGVVITAEAFYFKNIMEDPIRIPWKKMSDNSWVSGTTMYLGRYKIELTWMGEETAEAFSQVINGLVKQLNASVNVLAQV